MYPSFTPTWSSESSSSGTAPASDLASLYPKLAPPMLHSFQPLSSIPAAAPSFAAPSDIPFSDAPVQPAPDSSQPAQKEEEPVPSEPEAVAASPAKPLREPEAAEADPDESKEEQAAVSASSPQESEEFDLDTLRAKIESLETETNQLYTDLRETNASISTQFALLRPFRDRRAQLIRTAREQQQQQQQPTAALRQEILSAASSERQIAGELHTLNSHRRSVEGQLRSLGKEMRKLKKTLKLQTSAQTRQQRRSGGAVNPKTAEYLRFMAVLDKLADKNYEDDKKALGLEQLDKEIEKSMKGEQLLRIAEQKR